MGRSDLTRSDSTHPRLFIEGKLRASDYVTKLFDATKKLAKKESKIPVVVISVKGRPGQLLVVDPHDLPALAAEYQAARDAEQQVFENPATLPIDAEQRDTA